MTNNSENIIGRIGTIDIVKFAGDEPGHEGAAFDPDAKFMNMTFEPGPPDDAFYIVRWETGLDRKSVAPIMGSLALAEPSTNNYLLGSKRRKDKVPGNLLEAEAIADKECTGIRVEQKEQTLLWRLPIMDDPSAVVAAFLTKKSDLEVIAQLALDTAKPAQLDYVVTHLPLFHQAYSEYADLVCTPAESKAV